MSLRQLPEISAFQRHDGVEFEPSRHSVDAYDSTITATADSDNTISIYGEIGFDWLTATDNSEKRIGAALRSIGANDVIINLNSPGGNLFNGLAIYNLLRQHAAKVTVNVVGTAGSAASLIAMAGDEILMGLGATIMVHKASVLMSGNEFDAREVADLLGEMDEGMATIYASRADVEEEQAKAWMDRNRGNGTVFTARKAIETGLADGELDREAVAIIAKDSTKTPPPERVMEKRLIAGGFSPNDAKAFVSEFKPGARDAAEPATRDAGKLTAAIQQLQSTIRS